MEHRKRRKDRTLRSKPDITKCRKHPKHRQSPGVCSICLREKLSNLSSNSSRCTATTITSSSSSSSLSPYSSSGSSYVSPMHGHAKRPLSFLMSSSKNVLTKSRSMAVWPRMKEREGMDGKKRGGFWSKLIGSRSKRRTDEVLMHSRTVNERVINKVN